MQTNKLLCCLAIIASYSYIKPMELTQNKTLQINNFFPDEILKKILSESTSKLNLTSQVCKKFHEINNLILEQSWHDLTNQKDRYCIFCAINLLNKQAPKKHSYNHLSKLYCKLHNQLDHNAPNPDDIDLTDIKLYLQLDEKLQHMQDQNLIYMWPKLRNLISSQPESINLPDKHKTNNPKQIRKYLTNKYPQPAINKIIELDLSWSYLSQIPIELSYFTNLRELKLERNCLKSIDMLNTLTNLERLNLFENDLESIVIPDNLTNLQELYLSQNRLTSLKIPKTCIKLKDLWIDYNQLASIEIPETLTNLQHLDLENNRLSYIEIPETLIKLEVLRISNNKLTLIKIPDIIIKRIQIHGIENPESRCNIS